MNDKIRTVKYVIHRGHSGEVFGVRMISDQVGDSNWPLVHLPHHSPTGFEIGYGGSGPADLALAILHDYFAEEPLTVTLWSDGPTGLQRTSLLAWANHQRFKWDFLASKQLASGEFFEITAEQIGNWLSGKAGQFPELSISVETEKP